MAVKLGLRGMTETPPLVGERYGTVSTSSTRS